MSYRNFDYESDIIDSEVYSDTDFDDPFVKVVDLSSEEDGDENDSADSGSNNDHDDGYRKISRTVKTMALCASLNSCNLGYDIGVYTGVGELMQDDLGLSDVQLEIFIGSINIFAILGSLGSGIVLDKFGRRKTFQVAAILFTLGCCLTAAATHFSVSMIGRFFVGLGVGSGLAIDPMYIAEISPPDQRGYLVSWSELAINIGIVLGFSSLLVYAPFDDDVQWRIMVATGAVMPIAMLYLSQYVLLESPRWLVAQGEIPEAHVILSKLNPNSSEEEIIELVNQIQDSLEEEKLIESKAGWDVVFSSAPSIRRMVTVGVGVAIAQQICGIDGLQYYIVQILEDAGIEDEYEQAGWLIMIGVLKLCFIIFAMSRVDAWGRRSLMLISVTGMIFSLILLSTNNYVKNIEAITVVGISLYMCFFGIGMGPVAWLMPSEVFFTSIRAKAVSLAVCLNRLSGALMASTVLTAEDILGWGTYFLILAVICGICLIFIYYYVPETSGKSLEEMARYFAEITDDPCILTLDARTNSLTSPFLTDTETDLDTVKRSRADESNLLKRNHYRSV